MADQVALPNPRALYTQLRECSSAQARAEAALEFVRGCTSSEGGCLFLMRGGQLALAANSNGVEATPELLQEASRTWDRELDRHPEDNKTETLELSTIAALHAAAQESPVWRSSNSEAFERRLLSVYRGPNWLPVGLVMLRAREGRALVPIRQVHIEALCNALLDAGDVQERSAGAQTR
ncbi:MAG TPA: hypothetical protein VJV78_43435 [Polyangiales bacterium]|nr:hypothetical protein [Polyangiales bacterium]